MAQPLAMVPRELPRNITGRPRAAAHQRSCVVALRELTSSREGAHALTGAQGRNNTQQVATLLQCVGVAVPAGNANTAPDEAQDVEAGGMQAGPQLKPNPFLFHAGGCVGRIVVGDSLPGLGIDSIGDGNRISYCGTAVASAAGRDNHG